MASERTQSHEAETSPPPLEYCAVPLDLALDDSFYVDYMRTSLEDIGQKVDAAMELAYEKGWVVSEDIGRTLREVLLQSLLDSQAIRIDRNRKSHVSKLLGPDDGRARKAVFGTATPLELLSLLEDHPELDSVELAKLFHPLDASASNVMGADVTATIVGIGEAVEHGLPRYKLKSVIPELPVATVLRKQVVSDYTIAARRIQVVRREAFLVRGDDEIHDFDPLISRKIRNDQRFPELAQKIEGYYPELQALPDLRWLQPIASSYYAKYVELDAV